MIAMIWIDALYLGGEIQTAVLQQSIRSTYISGQNKEERDQFEAGVLNAGDEVFMLGR